MFQERFSLLNAMVVDLVCRRNSFPVLDATSADSMHGTTMHETRNALINFFFMTLIFLLLRKPPIISVFSGVDSIKDTCSRQSP